MQTTEGGGCTIGKITKFTNTELYMVMLCALKKHGCWLTSSKSIACLLIKQDFVDEDYRN